MQPTQQTQKIVIVEDNVSLADIYKTRLEMLGYTCFVANDGIAALYIIQKEIPDLVLLDLMVPNIAGDQILARMRASNWGKDIPVFIISNLNEADAPAGLRDLNIMGYVVKANLADDGLDKIVNSILRPADQPAQAPTSTEQPSLASSPVEQPTLAPMPAEQPPPTQPPIQPQFPQQPTTL